MHGFYEARVVDVYPGWQLQLLVTKKGMSNEAILRPEAQSKPVLTRES